MLEQLNNLFKEHDEVQAAPSALVELVYELCVKYSILPEKIRGEITQLNTLRAKIDKDVIAEYLAKVTLEDFESYLSWYYSISNKYWGGSKSTEDVDNILNTYFNISWESDTLAVISKKGQSKSW